ncbi:hypothetical protein, partial [Bacteroides heparinolyticus]|uniref:hypothetical protein n=2 Tax=Prevotella heparinolytica TaxID=28113 RepID=UPI00359FD688
FLLLKAKGGLLSGGYFLNAPVHGGQAEEKRTFQAGLPRPVLTAAILCRDRGKCPSRQTQVFEPSDASV